MSNNELMIPEASEVPAYLRNPELARKANEDAAAGISTGFPARVKISGKSFVLVDGNGKEVPFPQSKLVIGPDENAYMPVIFLAAKKALNKTWFAAAYNPNMDGQAPDCFSLDGERPSPASPVKQAEVCAACPQNAFGSGKDQAGNPTAGKACADTKILAAFVSGFGVHQFKVPPASLKNFGLYVKQLSAAGIAFGHVKTLVGFDPTQSYGVYIFRFGGYIGEQLLPQLAKLAESPEVNEIVNPVTAAVATKAPSPIAPPPPPAQPAQPEVMDDLGLGDLGNVKQAQTVPPAKQAPPAPPTQPTPDIAAGAAVSDADLMKELGL